MSADQPTPDVETVLAEHQRLLDGPGSCRRGDWPPDANDVTWPAHLAAALEPVIREREAEALEDAAAAVKEECSHSRSACFCTSADWLYTRAATHRTQP